MVGSRIDEQTGTTAPAGVEDGWDLLPGTRVTELVLPIGHGPTWRRGVTAAVRYARHWGLPVRLLHVRPGRQGDDGPDDRPDVSAEAHRLATSYQIEACGEEVVSDRIAPAITSAATDGSLIVLATDHVDQLATTGSVGESVVRASDRPVLLCGPHCGEPRATDSAGGVVVALDGSTWAEAAIGPAVAVAARSGTRLWAVHVAPESSVAEAERLRKEGNRVSLSAYVRGVAERLEADGVSAGWQLVQGDPVGGIVQFARRQGAELIVTTTHGESGLARRVLGSVAMGVVRTVTVPVLIVPTDTRDASELP